MSEQATRLDPSQFAGRLVPWVALGVAALGVLLTWTSDDSVQLNGIQGPNNGWLVLIFAGLAVPWARAAARGSWAGVAGVLGASLVMGGTAVENWLDARDVLGASASFGLVLVVVASVALAGTAVARGVDLVRASKDTT